MAVQADGRIVLTGRVLLGTETQVETLRLEPTARLIRRSGMAAACEPTCATIPRPPSTWRSMPTAGSWWPAGPVTSTPTSRSCATSPDGTLDTAFADGGQLYIDFFLLPDIAESVALGTGRARSWWAGSCSRTPTATGWPASCPDGGQRRRRRQRRWYDAGPPSGRTATLAARDLPSRRGRRRGAVTGAHRRSCVRVRDQPCVVPDAVHHAPGHRRARRPPRLQGQAQAGRRARRHRPRRSQPGEFFGLLGPERRRQDDAHQDPDHAAAADRGHGAGLRLRRRDPDRRDPPDHEHRLRRRAVGLRPAPGPRAAVDVQPVLRPAGARRLAPRRRADGGGRHHRASASRRSRSCPPASARSSTSRAACSTTRGSSSSTSRRSASTSPRRAPCASWCGTGRPPCPAGRSCSPATTWPRWTSCASAWPSSIAAASSPSAARPSSSAGSSASRSSCLELDRLDAGPAALARLPGVVSAVTADAATRATATDRQTALVKLVLQDDAALGGVVSALGGLGAHIVSLHKSRAEPRGRVRRAGRARLRRGRSDDDEDDRSHDRRTTRSPTAASPRSSKRRRAIPSARHGDEPAMTANAPSRASGSLRLSRHGQPGAGRQLVSPARAGHQPPRALRPRLSAGDRPQARAVVGASSRCCCRS